MILIVIFFKLMSDVSGSVMNPCHETRFEPGGSGFSNRSQGATKRLVEGPLSFWNPVTRDDLVEILYICIHHSIHCFISYEYFHHNDTTDRKTRYVVFVHPSD
jgi:hypothetical protein